jgi:hypothetical protein
MKTKRCPKCDKIKNIDKFSKDKTSKDGLNGKCKKCCRQYKLDNKDKLKLQTKVWNKNNIEKNRLSKKNWYKINPEYNKNHRENNREKYRQATHRWRLSKLEECRKKSREWVRNKRKSNIGFKLSTNISCLIRHSLKSNGKGFHWEDITGYKKQDLKQHLEKQFTSGMSWQNYGYYLDEHGKKCLGWEIDHIKAISKFKFKNYDNPEFKACWALSNLRPMWATTKIINGIEHLGNRNKNDK